ncbi:EAL domain-containing protein [Helicobacter sp. 23-1044]
MKLADDILYSVAQVLKSYFKNENYLLYRIHGDDFAILWTNCTDRAVFIQKLEGFLDYLGKKEILIDNYTYLNISATIGVAFSYESAKYSMVNAIMALHHAKEYRNPIVIYNRNLPILNVFKNNIQYTEIVYQALKNKDVIPYFQRIKGIQPHNANENHIKYEALMRIKDRDGRIVLPGLFLEVSKRSSSYSKLSRLMIESTFQRLAERKDCVFSINLALEDMNSTDFLMWFMERIVHYKIEGRVVAEITEQESVEEFESVNNFITNIRDIGVKIALDDFGSGYSNFSILMKLQIDYLKLDGSLISNIDKDKNAQIIVQTIVQFAKSLDIKTVAEFVSSEAIYNTIKDMGIDYAQGYFTGKPVELN